MSWTDAMIATAHKMQKEGHSTSTIGERLGIGKNAVVGKLRRLRNAALGMPAHPKAVTHHRAKTFIEPPPPPNPAARYEAMGTEHKPCEFPTGERRSFTVCGDDRVIGKLYCPDHCAKIYIPIRPRQLTAEAAARIQALEDNAAKIQEALCPSP